MLEKPKWINIKDDHKENAILEEEVKYMIEHMTAVKLDASKIKAYNLSERFKNDV